MTKLLLTAVTSAGRASDIEFPLHPQTRSADAVSDLLSSLLEKLSRELETRRDVSDGEALQAIAMLLAIRARMVDAERGSVRRVLHELAERA